MNAKVKSPVQQTCVCGSSRNPKVNSPDDKRHCVCGSTMNTKVNCPDQQTNFMLNNPISCNNSISIISLIEYNLDKMSKDEKLSDKNWNKFNYLNYFPSFVGGLLIGSLTFISDFVCHSDTKNCETHYRGEGLQFSYKYRTCF